MTGIAGGLATGLLAGAAAPGILAGLGLAAVTEMGVRAAGGRGSLIDMASRCLNRPDYSGVSTHDDLEMNAPSGITIDAPNRLDFSKSNSIGRGAQKVFYPGKATGCWGFRTKTRWCVASSRAMNEAIETEANALKGIAAVGGIRVTSVLDEGYTVDGCYAYLRQDIDGTASKGEDKANFMHALFNLSQSAKATAKADLERLRAFLERHTIGDLQVIVTNQGHIWVFDPNGFQKGKAMDHAARQIGLWLNNLDVKPNIPPGKVGRD